VTNEELAGAVIAAFEGTQPDGVVLACAVVDRDGTAMAASDPSGRDGVFELGSITKALTGTLLGALVVRGTVELNAPVARWLDAGDNGEITLLQLATHTSGLPRLAPNWRDAEGFDRADPYAAFTVELAEQGLRATARDGIGTTAYSNFGFQLLGLVLERAGGAPYGELLRDEVLGPLGMEHTSLRTSAGLDGHETDGRVVPHWTQPLPAAGGTEGRIVDLAALARAVIDPPPGRAGEALKLATQSHFRESDRKEKGLGWTTFDGHRIFHNGGTGGFTSSLVVDTRTRRGVAILVNVADLSALDRAAFLAAAGEDPAPARPGPPSNEPAGPEFAAAAAAFAEALRANDFAAAAALMAPATAEALPPERLRSFWSDTLAELGALTETTPAAGTVRPFGAATRVDLTFERGALALHCAHGPSGAIAGVLLIGPDDPAPF